VECDNPEEDPCVTLLCLGDACGFYRCGDMPSDVELARFPPAAAPGSGPRRNWGGAGKLPGGAVMVFPNWNGGPERIIPPSRQLTAGRWEKHHIFPLARDLAEWFEGQGVKIHHYTMPIPRDLHQRIHNPGGSGGRGTRLGATTCGGTNGPPRRRSTSTQGSSSIASSSWAAPFSPTTPARAREDG
jgi:uncharacterized lipoprotein (TIGR02269 family)